MKKKQNKRNDVEIIIYNNRYHIFIDNEDLIQFSNYKDCLVFVKIYCILHNIPKYKTTKAVKK